MVNKFVAIAQQLKKQLEQLKKLRLPINDIKIVYIDWVSVLLVTKSFPNVVSFAEILPLSPFSTSTNPKSARPLESFAPCTW
jgi:hypothetical protein